MKFILSFKHPNIIVQSVFPYTITDWKYSHLIEPDMEYRIETCMVFNKELERKMDYCIWTPWKT